MSTHDDKQETGDPVHAMTDTTELVQGRARNAAQTRCEILQAARNRFVAQGYDGASVRDIAADVGVDAALINRYFGSKEELLREVLAGCQGGGQLMEGDLKDFGRRIAHMMVYDPPSCDKMDGLMIVLLSAASPKARETIRKLHNETFHQPFEAWLGGPDAGVRARLAASMLMGFSVARAIDGERLLDEGLREDLCERLAVVLQACVD